VQFEDAEEMKQDLVDRRKQNSLRLRRTFTMEATKSVILDELNSPSDIAVNDNKKLEENSKSKERP